MDEIVEMMAEAIAATSGHNEPEAWVNEARAALSTLHAGGWRIVPGEPTKEMMAAGVIENDKYATEIAPCSAFRANDCYRAMLAASPIKMKE